MYKALRYLFLLFALANQQGAWAQFPSIDPQALYTDAQGEETSDASQGMNAPLRALFSSNPSNLGAYQARYEWKIYEPGKKETPLVHRFEENMEYTFERSGTFLVQVYATFVLDGDTITFPEEGEENPFQVTIRESKLELPNAFSPNGDGFNDIYKVKEGYQSIVSFKATIINRWGQKIYSWTNIAEGWDGKWNGRTVKDGVYFVIVDARGADGHHYKIRKDVNVLTGYESQNQNNTGDN
ncbi:MAG: gliding motility-associated C-terminal domain-containing protein [Bacteroidaceae bacterium]|nr:gliding motility-associated C-terminal domain-containing protein [Prevotellaceae bacterium]MDY5631626.1 gliding motility-associated C-terminal domain-containing protein [Bacteroidaceae bacterium]